MSKAERSRPLYEQAYSAIRHLIAKGELMPGALVDVPQLVEDLEISRTPIREAIRQLLVEGLLELERDGRPTVYAPGVEELADIYVVRTAIESLCGSMLAAQVDDLDVTPLENAIKVSRRAMEEDNWQMVSKANGEFHHGLVSLVGNETGARVLETLGIHINRYRNLSMQYTNRRSAALQRHVEILGHITAGDPEAAREAIHHHVASSGAFAIATLKPDPTSDTPSIRWLRRFS